MRREFSGAVSRWQRIEEIFAEALALPPGRRPSFLDHACDDDEALRAELLSLLDAEEQAPSAFLENPAELPMPSARLAAPPPGPGDQVGPYRLLEAIGSGGMGKVYLAERSDGAFDRQVAVKVLRRGMEDDANLLRFDLERRILAGLEHPGIARLLDGGTTPAGSPYVVMELVHGEPIDVYCEAGALSVRERVELVLEVCAAVAAAHQQLVVHRDIKPSNVWVDHDGRVKLLDFGIAKILESSSTFPGAATTASWQRLLTPSHASPEQVRGEAITVATDVYLLGILLYELLTGRLPHHFPSRSLAEAERVLTTETPTAPSRLLRESEPATQPSGIDPFDTDLDFVVLEALRPEPAERYASVADLADDLRRFLDRRPIRARLGSRRYRVRKLLQRYWRPLAAGALGLALLLTFTVDRTMQVASRERALAKAETYLARSEALSGFVEELFWNANPRAAKGEPLTVAEALSRGEARLARGGLGSPELEAEAHALFGRIRLDLGNYESARTSLELALQRFERVAEPDPPLELLALQARGDLALARLHLVSSPDEEGAAEELEAAVADARYAYERSRWLRATDPARALELSNPLAEIHCQLEEWDQAAPLTAEAMELLRLAGDPRTLAVAQALGRRALILKNLDGDLAAARELYSRALEIYLELEGPVHPEVANLHNQLALVAEGLGDLEAAAESHRAGIEVLRRLYPGGHGSQRRALAHLGRVLLLQKNTPGAEQVYQQLIELCLGLYGPTGGWTVQHSLELGQLLLDTSRPAEAEPLLRGLLSPEQRAARPAGSRLIVRAEGLLGVALLAQENPAGEPLLRRSLETLRAHSSGYEDALEWLSTAERQLLAGR